MSWQLGTMILLMLALGAGLLWYEGSKPPSQIVALVAVLAALAVAGRIVLAPVPNVVATTDIVFISGYVLGPAPGFAVGALGGLVSNFWLGQGVWTPWQMLGWGMTGVAGAGLWYVTRGRANRLQLALACGAAGLVFGAWMNFQSMVSFGGEISLDRYLALEVRAIPFDLAHITGNVIFALVAGPAMVSALRRFRERFEWQKVSGLAGILLVAVALTAVASAPRASAANTEEATKAANWLRTQQNADGGFPSSPGGESSLGITSRAMLGLAAADINPLDVKISGVSPYGYLVDRREGLDDAGEIALAILALKTVGVNPKDFEGRNLISALEKRRGDNNSFGNKVNTAAYAAIAFKSAGADGYRNSVVTWLKSAENEDKGGWGISDSADPDADSTGAVLQAYTEQKSVSAAMKFLERSQKSSGGYVSGSTVNSQSTGLVVQGALASGKGANYPRANGNSGYDFLVARQQDDGSVWYSKDSDQTRVWVTADVLPALAKKSLPIKEPQREPDPADQSSSSSDSSGGVAPSTGSTSGTPVPDSSSPAPSTATVAPSTGSGGSNSGGSGTSDPVPLDTTEPVIPVAPTEAVLAASLQGPEPSPLIAIMIGLLVTSGLAGGTVWLTRHNGW